MHHRASRAGERGLLRLALNLLLALIQIVMRGVALVLNRLVVLLLQLLRRGRQGLGPGRRGGQERKKSEGGYRFHHVHRITDKHGPAFLKDRAA